MTCCEPARDVGQGGLVPLPAQAALPRRAFAGHAVPVAEDAE